MIFSVSRLTTLLLTLLLVTSKGDAHEQHDVFEEFQDHDHQEPHLEGQIVEENLPQQVEEIPHNVEEVPAEEVREMSEEDRHLQEHLAEEGYLDSADMSESEKQYHHFLVHDYDNDEELDGIELMQSFYHGAKAAIFPEEELAAKIDFTFDNFDTDRNGKLSFAEFMLSTARFTQSS